MLGAEQVPAAPVTLTTTCAARRTRSGRALRLVQARCWWAVLRTGEINTSELARREGMAPSYLARVVRLAFLAPATTEAILAGRQRAGVTIASLTL
jgi:hypothetical protein